MNDATPHDLLFKRTFSDLAQAAAHLRAVLPSEVSRCLDWPKLQLAPPELLDDVLSKRTCDLLFTVPLLNAAEDEPQEVLLYLLFEHQSRNHPLMPFRLWEYMVRILATWLAVHGGHPKKLPLVIPIVMYHGVAPWTAPLNLRDLFHGSEHPQWRDLAPSMPYALVDLQRLHPDDLVGDEWGRVVQRMFQLRDQRQQIELLATILTGLVLRRNARQVTLINYVMAVNPDLRGREGLSTLEARLHELLGEEMYTFEQYMEEKATERVMAIGEQRGEQRGIVIGEQRGEQRGIVIGEQRAQRETLRGLIIRRFGEPTAAQSERLNELSVAALESVVDALLDGVSMVSALGLVDE